LNGLVRLTFDSSGNYVSGFAGEVTGLGSLFFTNGFASVQPRFYLTGTNNTYRGSTQVAGGWITVASIKNIGEPCSLGQPMTVADATIRLGSGDLPGRLTYAGSGNTTDRTIELSGTSVNGWSRSAMTGAVRWLSAT
jgi:autotransporter-associated beta strand protein